jgi:adenylyltransferase/sulfurtransferase
MELTGFIERYSRQIMLKEVGVKGQVKLFKSRIAVIGCGATGTALAEFLARAGVGFIRVVDRDIIELSNLHRTHLFRELDVLENLPKAYACAKRLHEINSSINVEYVVDSVSADNIEKLIDDVDLVIDGSDNIETRLLINEACIILNKPWIMMGVERWYGMTKFIDVSKGACYQCLVGRRYRGRENVCEVLGVSNAIVSLVTSIASTLALKYLLELPVEEDLFIVDALDLTIRKIKLNRNPECLACVKKEFVFLNKKESRRIRYACGSNMIEVLPEKILKIDFSRLRETDILKHIKVFDNKVAYIKVGDIDMILLDNGKALIKNIKDFSKAEELYNNILKELNKLSAIHYL